MSVNIRYCPNCGTRNMKLDGIQNKKTLSWLVLIESVLWILSVLCYLMPYIASQVNYLGSVDMTGNQMTVFGVLMQCGDMSYDGAEIIVVGIIILFLIVHALAQGMSGLLGKEKEVGSFSGAIINLILHIVQAVIIFRLFKICFPYDNASWQMGFWCELILALALCVMVKMENIQEEIEDEN